MLSIVLAASSRKPTGACLPVVLAHQARACCSACLLLSLHCPRRPPRTVPSKQQPVGDPGASIAQRSAQALDRSVPNRSASVANPIRLWAGMDQADLRRQWLLSSRLLRTGLVRRARAGRHDPRLTELGCRLRVANWRLRLRVGLHLGGRFVME